jgi:hypothetical protein
MLELLLDPTTAITRIEHKKSFVYVSPFSFNLRTEANSVRQWRSLVETNLCHGPPFSVTIQQ